VKARRTTTTTQVIADWAEARFHDVSPLAVADIRLYGVTVLDAGALVERAPGAARLCFLGAVADLGDLLGARMVLELANFDAAVLLVGRWLVDVDTVARPGAFDVRRRARVVLACDDGGTAATVRFAHRAEQPEARLAVGTEALVLSTLWRAARR